MIQLAGSPFEVSEAGLALTRHRLRARIAGPQSRPAARSRRAGKQAFSAILFYLSVVLSLLLVALQAGPRSTSAAEIKVTALSQQILQGKFAIDIPSLTSLAAPAAALADKVRPVFSSSPLAGTLASAKKSKEEAQ